MTRRMSKSDRLMLTALCKKYSPRIVADAALNEPPNEPGRRPDADENAIQVWFAVETRREILGGVTPTCDDIARRLGSIIKGRRVGTNNLKRFYYRGKAILKEQPELEKALRTQLAERDPKVLALPLLVHRSKGGTLESTIIDRVRLSEILTP